MNVNFYREAGFKEPDANDESLEAWKARAMASVCETSYLYKVIDHKEKQIKRLRDKAHDQR